MYVHSFEFCDWPQSLLIYSLCPPLWEMLLLQICWAYYCILRTLFPFSSCDDDCESGERCSSAVSDICCRLVDYNRFYFTIFYSSVSNAALSYCASTLLLHIICICIFFLKMSIGSSFIGFDASRLMGPLLKLIQSNECLSEMFFSFFFWFLKGLLYSLCFYIHSCVCNINA